MLKINRQTDQAIMLLAHVAQLPEGAVVSARAAAEWSGLSPAMVSKILKLLARAELIVSQRGLTGGYRLARPLARTSVADVIRALEGPIRVVECSNNPGACDHEGICPVRVNWQEINRQFEEILERVPLSRMIGCEPQALHSISTEAASRESR